MYLKREYRKIFQEHEESRCSEKESAQRRKEVGEKSSLDSVFDEPSNRVDREVLSWRRSRRIKNILKLLWYAEKLNKAMWCMSKPKATNHTQRTARKCYKNLRQKMDCSRVKLLFVLLAFKLTAAQNLNNLSYGELGSRQDKHPAFIRMHEARDISVKLS